MPSKGLVGPDPAAAAEDSAWNWETPRPSAPLGGGLRRGASGSSGYLPSFFMLNVPLLWFTFVTPPNELLAPERWCKRAELTVRDDALDLPVDPDER